MNKLILILFCVPIFASAHQKIIKNDKEFNKYLMGYAQEAAKFQICGEYERVDIANIGIYLDEILSPAYLKQQVKKYGSRYKAGIAAMKNTQKLADKYQQDLVKKGIPSGMCAKLLNE